MIKKKQLTTRLSIQKGLRSLLFTLKQFLKKEIELERIVRVAILLIKSGVSTHNSIFREIAIRCTAEQKLDGGWIGVEDSVCSVAFLKEFKEFSQEYKDGLNWIRKQGLKSGEWGKTSRDIGRIPITGFLLYLLPELSTKEKLAWLEKEWKKEFGINPKLTYKAAFILMALKSCNYQFADSNLFDNTLDWLASQQNEDYGWGPCKGHPIGSTPFCTGVAITGLLQYPNRIDQKVITNGLKWIEKNQLQDGLWPDHYIEEGSIWSFYALTEGYKLLKERQ